MAYFYSAYGLHIKSDIDLLLPPVQPAPDADIVIQLGEINVASDIGWTRGKDGVLYAFHENNTLFLHWDIIGSYRISKGRDILIQPNTPERHDDIRQPILGTVMATALQQRGCLVLHGSAVSVDGECIIFTGNKGQGKSTLAGWLGQQGFPLLSDDVCAMDCPDRMSPVLRPAFPKIKLYADSLQHLGEAPADYPQVHPEVPKYVQDVSKGFCSKKQPVGAVCSLQTGDELTLTPLNGMEAMKEILTHMLINRFPENQPVELCKEIFLQAAYLTKTLPVYRLTRPRDLRRLPDTTLLLRQLADRPHHCLS